MPTYTPADHLGAVDRSLSTVTRGGQEMRMLTVTRTFDAAPDEVWDALTTAERIERWMMPITGDLREGGRYQLEGNAGGEILSCAPPERLSITWEYGGVPSWVDVTLSADGGRTALVLEHTAPVDPEMWAQFGPGAVGIGWEMALMGLAEHLAVPDAPRPPREEVPDLTDFISGSSAAWGAADAAAGTDPEQALAAAERCLAAYTAPAE